MVGPGFVYADACSAQLGYPIIPSVYANTVVTVVVPISATCSTQYGSQVYATANAYDLNTNTAADTVNTVLTSVNGGYTFTGQLGFNLPASIQGHWVQVAVTIYSDQAGNQLTTSGEAFQVNTGTVQVITTTITSLPAGEFAPGTPGTYGGRREFIFAYVAIAAILATVIIVTVGLIVYSRRPNRYYYPTPPGY